MASNYWAKLWIEILDDRKMGTLPDNLWRRFFECILLAKEINKNGRLPNIADIAWRVRVDVETATQELEALARIGLLDYRSDNVLDGYWFIVNFEKRQSSMTPAERMQRMRDTTKKRAYYEHSDATVTNRNAETEEEEETEKKKRKNPSSTFPFEEYSKFQEHEGPAREILTRVYGVLTNDAADHFETVDDLVLKYGAEETETMLVKSHSAWKNTTAKNGKKYRASNFGGWVSWAAESLNTGSECWLSDSENISLAERLERAGYK